MVQARTTSRQCLHHLWSAHQPAPVWRTILDGARPVHAQERLRRRKPISRAQLHAVQPCSIMTSKSRNLSAWNSCCFTFTVFIRRRWLVRDGSFCCCCWRARRLQGRDILDQRRTEWRTTRWSTVPRMTALYDTFHCNNIRNESMNLTIILLNSALFYNWRVTNQSQKAAHVGIEQARLFSRLRVPRSVIVTMMGAKAKSQGL